MTFNPLSKINIKLKNFHFFNPSLRNRINWQQFKEVGDVTYTNRKDPNFDCGRYKLFCELNGNCTAGEDVLDLRESGEKEIVVSDEGWASTDEITGYCGATLINDRFAITAGHCHKIDSKDIQRVTIR